jgi:hypothetical protein
MLFSTQWSHPAASMAFSYDPQLAALVSNDAGSIETVVEILQAIDALLDGSRDGLKWFNSIYLEVTLAVQKRVIAGDFDTPQGAQFIADLDFRFADFYFSALRSWLAGAKPPACWRLLFQQRSNGALARIQFALAGINAHINRDLAIAITKIGPPAHDTAEYRAYTALNFTLDSLIDEEKKELMVTLAGDALPGADRVEAAIASWSVAAARESAWVHAEILSKIEDEPLLSERLIDVLDGAATLAGKALLTL